MTEADVQAAIRLALAEYPNVLLWRNNNGALRNQDGELVHYGLGSGPKGGIGSSDLIGPVSVIVTPDMVGRLVAVFTAIEVKVPNARTDPDRLAKQTNFIRTIQAAGGYAGFADSIEKSKDIVNGRNKI